ncbi:MAG TPA: non-homologous end-joining DNA ligase [Acidimicrobiales bacterium]|nr:non-homologous end-joining DNA ligase [Acidimicrobiales bacterium]
MKRTETRVTVDGRELTVSNLDKVLYPKSGFTKGQLIDYYIRIAPQVLVHIADRPLTMKRYPDGVEKPFFYEKHLPVHAPEWVRTATVSGSDGTIDYAVVSDLPSLVWVANLGCIELHVPLWHVGRRTKLPGPPDLVVFDLDPGEGTTVVECAEVAMLIEKVLAEDKLPTRVKTSGSKGLQVYAPTRGAATWDDSRSFAHEVAQRIEQDRADLVTSNMRKSLRKGKVLIDWSQNHPAKTTVAAYSVRARDVPTVSTPVTWDEVQTCHRAGDAALLEFDTDAVIDRVKKMGDLFAFEAPGDTAAADPDGLAEYRAKRDGAKTPEPMGSTGPQRGARPTRAPRRRSRGAAGPPRFVIQEHHARALHWDFRLEHDGVLASWALPKGVPIDPRVNHLAVHTEDHPMDYAGFEGEIPRGEYGGGQVQIWDRGHYELEKWSDTEVMVVLHGERASGRYVLFRTRGKNWMIHRMDPAPAGYAPIPESIRPMLATAGRLPPVSTGWAFEVKWDGVRALAYVDGGRVRLESRNGKELTSGFPEFRALGETLGARQCILDGEIVVLGDRGIPDFGRLAHRLHLGSDSAVKRAAAASPANYVLFDLLYLDGHSLLDRSYDERRAQLESLELKGKSFVTGDSYRDVEGADILAGTRDAGLEGVIAKQRSSTYLPGRRSEAWIKVKNFRTQEVVIGGWTPGAGARVGTIGALLVGIPSASGLRYAGKVGTGFSDRDLQELTTMLTPLGQDESPFTPASDVRERAPHYVRPLHVGEVQFGEWTSAGRLRHPSWRGLRPDKSPEDVGRES